MRWAIVVFGMIVLSTGILQSQEVGKVRSWTGSLGRSQFGVFSKDGMRLVFADGNDVLVVDTEDGTNPMRLSGHTKVVSLARFSGDGKKIVSIGQDETIRTWDPSTGKQLSEVKANTGDPSTLLTVSQNGNLIGFSSGKDQMLRVMDLSKNSERQRIGLTSANLTWRCVTLDGRFAMSNGIENGTKIWDTATGVAVTIDNGHHNYCGQFSYDGTRAVLAGGFVWDVWDLRRKAKLAAGMVTGGNIYAIASSPTGDRLLTGLSDGTIWLWDVKTGKEIFVLRGHEHAIAAVMFSPDRRFAVSEDGKKSIILWRLPK